MKHILTVFACLAICGFAYEPEVTLPPEEKSLIKEMTEIADLMDEVHDNLREDRHDKVVHLKLDEIDERIGKLIVEGEDIERHKRKIEELDKRIGQSPDGKTPTRVSKLPAVNPAKVKLMPQDPDSWISRDYWLWSHLPRASRDEIIQCWAEEIPIRWRLRISAYFLSIGAAEKEAEDQALKKHYEILKIKYGEPSSSE